VLTPPTIASDSLRRIGSEATDNYDFALVIALWKGSFLGAGPEFEPPNEKDGEIMYRVFHGNLPSTEHTVALSDVSGTLGLLWPISNHDAKVKASAFERQVSDTLLWTLTECGFSPDKRTTVVLQGPLLPKLRGRLSYRCISESISIFALTYQPEWFGRIEAAAASFEYLQRRIDKSRDSGDPLVGPTYPPVAQNHVTRSWVCSVADRPVHFELITNAWESSGDRFTTVQEWVGRLIRDDMLPKADKKSKADDVAARLPLPLALAVHRVAEIKKAEEEFAMLAQDLFAHRHTELPAHKDPIYIRHQKRLDAMYGEIQDGRLKVGETAPSISKAASRGKPLSTHWGTIGDAYKRYREVVGVYREDGTR